MGIGDSRLADMEATSLRVINWHLLELTSDSEDKETSDSEDKDRCLLCHELRLGPTYHCRKCRLLLHKPCIEQQSQTLDMKVEHERWVKKHHMIRTQVAGDKMIVICSLCRKSVSGSAYKCFIPNCHFHLHPSCANLPPKFDEHPAHPKHTLYAQEPSGHACCVLCSKLCYKGLFYRCLDCEFTLDIKCACSFQIKVDNCWPHKFILIPKSILQFTCQACGWQKDDAAYLCKICGLLIHGDCVQRYLGTIKVRGYPHFLTCTFSLPPGDPKCRVCNNSVDTRYAAYLRHKCGYIVHLWCANVIKELEARIEFGASSSNCDETDTASPLVIKKHVSHREHNLILYNDQPIDDQRCGGCMNQIIFPPFYSCKSCSFFLHERCAQLPRQILQPHFHRDPLTLEMPSFRINFRYKACSRTRSGLFYSLPARNALKLFTSTGAFDQYDSYCALLPEVLKHEGHQHYLLRNEGRQGRCSACGVEYKYTFRCSTCEFHLCYGCATYPLKARHGFDEHLLELTYGPKDDSGEQYCLLCEEKSNPNYWFYHCIECNFTGHPKCIMSHKIEEKEEKKKEQKEDLS